MSDESALTALAGRNRITCSECGDVLETQEDNVRAVRWGFWNEEKQWFDRRPHSDHYCPQCWRENFKRDKAAHYHVEDADVFWGLLAAADGTLVADLRPIFVGGRPWIRVVDGELQAMRSTREMVREGETHVLKFGAEKTDVDREWFDQLFRAEREHPQDEHPTIALLKPPEETPFAEWDDLHPDQTRLTDD